MKNDEYVLVHTMQSDCAISEVQPSQFDCPKKLRKSDANPLPRTDSTLVLLGRCH